MLLKQIFLSILLVLTFLCSCQHKTESVVPQKMNLIGEEIQVDVIVAPGDMVIHGNLLIKRRDYKAETAIRIFNLDDLTFITDAIGRERGPGIINEFENILKR